MVGGGKLRHAAIIKASHATWSLEEISKNTIPSPLDVHRVVDVHCAESAVRIGRLAAATQVSVQWWQRAQWPLVRRQASPLPMLSAACITELSANRKGSIYIVRKKVLSTTVTFSRCKVSIILVNLVLLYLEALFDLLKLVHQSVQCLTIIIDETRVRRERDIARA